MANSTNHMESSLSNAEPISSTTTQSLTDRLLPEIALYIAIGFGVLSILILITLVCVKCRKRNRFNMLNKELNDICAHPKENMTYEVLSPLAQQFFNSSDHSKRLLKEFVVNEQEDRKMEKFRETIKIPGCRYVDLQCLIKSQVQVSGHPKYMLHMNKLFDCNKKPIFLAQAPVKDEFPLFVQAIVDEKIGIIVWVGSLLFGGEKFDAYFPINRMGSIRFGFYSAKNIQNDYSKSKGFDQFEIVLSKRSKEGPAIDNTIYILHVDFWPDGTSREEFVKLGKIVKHLCRLHKQQRQVLPGILMHCYNGVEQSAAFCAIYLGYQMWQKKESVNLIGIMRYIRKHRHSAFTYGSSPDALVPIVYGTMEALISIGDGES